MVMDFKFNHLSSNVTAKPAVISRLANKASLVQLIWQDERFMQSWFRGATSPQKPTEKKAEVVKLANTLRSGRSGRKSLWVQLPPSAFLSRKVNFTTSVKLTLTSGDRFKNWQSQIFETLLDCINLLSITSVVKMKGEY